MENISFENIHITTATLICLLDSIMGSKTKQEEKN